MNMPVASNSTQELIHYSLEGLKTIYRPHFFYKKAGVMLMDICSENSIQGNLFDTVDRTKHRRLMDVLDNVFL